MTTITFQQMNKISKDLQQTMLQAKRRLFEFETMKSIYEHQMNKSKKYTNVHDIILDAKNA